MKLCFDSKVDNLSNTCLILYLFIAILLLNKKDKFIFSILEANLNKNNNLLLLSKWTFGLANANPNMPLVRKWFLSWGQIYERQGLIKQT